MAEKNRPCRPDATCKSIWIFDGQLYVLRCEIVNNFRRLFHILGDDN